jgi:hypothetical protein
MDEFKNSVRKRLPMGSSSAGSSDAESA